VSDIKEHKSCRFRCIDRSYDLGYIRFHYTPVIRTQDQQGYFAGGQVLLIPQFLIAVMKKSNPASSAAMQ